MEKTAKRIKHNAIADALVIADFYTAGMPIRMIKEGRDGTTIDREMR